MVVLIYELELAIFMEGGGYLQQKTLDLFLECDFFVLRDPFQLQEYQTEGGEVQVW